MILLKALTAGITLGLACAGALIGAFAIAVLSVALVSAAERIVYRFLHRK